MQNSFTVNQDLTLREFFSSTLYYFLKGKLLRRYFLLLSALMLLSWFLGFATTSKKPNLIIIASSFMPFIILFLIALLVVLLICLYIYKSKPYLFKDISYDFTHWGVVRHGERTEFSKPWREISKYKESKAFFLLYIKKTDFHIIQKRMFKDLNELNDFRILLKENINH